jgi:DNA-binding beta-propeller fold protein YncE
LASPSCFHKAKRLACIAFLGLPVQPPLAERGLSLQNHSVMRFIIANKKSLVILSAVGLIAALSGFEKGPASEGGGAKSVGNSVPANSFTNFESAHVSPIAMTPDGTKLLAVNTANNSLEVFTLSANGMVHSATIPVGLDPVTVRARTNNEAWVVCQVSDEISIVDLTLKATIRSLATENEPADLVFAGTPLKAYVSCAERESIQVFDPANLGTAPVEILLKGEQPRALAVSPNGSTVYCAFFESGNRTTAISGNNFFSTEHVPGKVGICSTQGGCTLIPNDVTRPTGPYGGVVPVPNAGAGFNPPLNPNNPASTETNTMIVRKNAVGQWMDDNNGNWTNIVTGGAGVRQTGWDMPDRDVAMIATSNNAVTYKSTLGNILMSMSVHPGTGDVFVVGTDATNEVRFEPNLKGKFLRVNVSRFAPPSGAVTITDMNPHINYNTHTSPPAVRVQSIGDPRAIAWRADGSKAYVTGMGSNNIITINATGARTAPEPIVVGEGPTGIVIDEARQRAYVINKFGGSISTIDLATDKETDRTGFFDPTPLVIKTGRKHLYNTHTGSGHGHISCGSCHVDARWDRLGWDLGDPSGDMSLVDGKNFHPLKGVKTTQFLIDIIGRGRGNLHWRGDKDGFQDFAGAFQHLQGTDAPMDAVGMQEFSDFLAACWYVPNPYRVYKPNSQSSTLRINPGRVRGTGTSFQSIPTAVNLFVAVNVNCVPCHNAQTGRGDLAGNGQVAGNAPGAGGTTNNTQGFTMNRNMAGDLRSTYRKTGFYYNTTECTSGFGLLSEGVMETWYNGAGVANYMGDYEPEILSWSGGIDPANCSQCFNTTNFPFSTTAVNDVLPAVGMRHTINGAIGSTTTLNILKDLADTRATEYAMVVKGIWGGVQRGFYYMGGSNYQPDQNGAAAVTHTALVTAAQAGGAPLTWTLVHPTTKIRHGVDRDMDGVWDFTDGDAVLDLSLFLEGPLNGTVMRSDLKTAGLLPATDPYGMGATADPSLLARSGTTAPVDWVMVQLRDNTTPTTVVDETAAMVLANGKVVMPNGEAPLYFADAPRAQYRVVAWHRNHLAAMSLNGTQLGTGVASLDFGDPVVAMYGTEPRRILGSIAVLWAGDVDGNGTLLYTGGGNDRDPILVRIGGSIPTNVVNGYHPEDVNLDGVVRYVGAANDRDPILQNIGGSVPTNSRQEQLP